MMRFKLLLIVTILLLASVPVLAQTRNMDAKFGLSIFSGGGSSTGVLFGAGVDFPWEKNLYIRPEFNITTHGGTPIQIAGLIKYEASKTERNTFYLDGGLGIWFYTGGPYLGLEFGGGAIFPLEGSRFSIPADVRLGPVFSSGSTIFQFTFSSGLRFAI